MSTLTEMGVSLSLIVESRPGLSEEGEEGERPPEWLELAGDLAWTATFSSVTSNTCVTEPSGVWNYAVLFCLTWHLWATQTTYDIRYYTNDWWHHLLFACQLSVYSILAALSGSFNVSWQVNPDATEVFKGNVTELTGNTMDANQEYLIKKSFRGINFMLFISRMLLLAQYIRVLWYRKRSKQFWSWQFLLTPLAILFAGGIFLGCYIMMKEDPNSKTVAITQLILWGVAVLSQAIAGAFTPEDGHRVLKNEGAMAPRLSSLTVIILGEGLNAICGTLSNSMNALGLHKTMVGQSLTMLIILYFIWLLYFDGFKIHYAPSKILEELWLCLHFPLHLSLILLLEGIKNVFIYVNVVESFSRLAQEFDKVMGKYSPSTGFPEHPTLEKLLQVLNISWKQETIKLQDAITADLADPTGGSVNVNGQIWRWWGTVIHSVILLYNDQQTDPEAEHNFEEFQLSSDAALANDFKDPDSPILARFYDIYFDKMAYTGHWIIPVSGTLILCMAIINTVQRWPRNRFAWGYSLSRFIIGATLILIGGITMSLPTIAIGYGVGVIVDRSILFLSVRSIRNTESLSRANFAYSSVEKGDYDPATGVDLAQLSHLPYGQERPHRSDSASAGKYAQEPMGSSASLYIAGGEEEKLHQESSDHLPYKP
ncbi:hypothetical protein FRC04_005685 [Tulasnella sp. 424]|nr:hypothetical protein FRC04_005685 [Tulasnella sp. 424]